MRIGRYRPRPFIGWPWVFVEAQCRTLKAGKRNINVVIDPDADNLADGMSVPSLRGRFLLASPTLADPHFSKTIVLIVRHDEDGALGLVLNRPLGVTLDEACSEDVEAARGVSVALFHGGPCAGPLVAVHNIGRLAEDGPDTVSGCSDSGNDEEEEGS